ncbi:MAG: hypothetical protein QMD46_10350 [Methanomicrobiales archaeon]|nr:hypothetical protein [Methanomicrobiales archaeon]MDI6877069.1 hypothetical protein [Methanomicrobiales archaeon]
MERKEIDEFRTLAQVLNEIERRYPDPESITLRQISELSQAHHLGVPDILALVILIRWGRIYTSLKQIGEERNEAVGYASGLPCMASDGSVRESAEYRPPPADESSGGPSIEFL